MSVTYLIKIVILVMQE